MDKVGLVNVAIANGASLSTAADTASGTVVGVRIPSEWTAAGVGFLVSDDGTTYRQLKVVDILAAPPWGTDELELLAAEIPTAESVDIAMDPNWFLCSRYVKVQSQTAGTPVNQGAARTVGLLIRNPV
jgi:hypothetical protein